MAENESEQDFVRAALLRRLADEEPAVVEAALASPSLALLPAGELAQGISRLLLFARQTLEGHAGDKASRKALREVVKKVPSHYLAMKSGHVASLRLSVCGLAFCLSGSVTQDQSLLLCHPEPLI